MKKNKSSKNWVDKQKNDQFVKKSKIFGYRSRSAFKLIELNEKFKILKKNTKLIDLGSSPEAGHKSRAKSLLMVKSFL